LNTIPYIGEFFSFLCALCWAIAIIFFRKSGDFIKPFALNLFKNSIASILFILTSFILAIPIFIKAPLHHFLLLATSGIIGIALADTLFFRALNILGASLTQIVNCMYMPIMIVLSYFFLNETFFLLQFIGTGMIILAINISSWKSKDYSLEKKDLLLGIFLAILSMTFMAIGVILVKPILAHYPIIWCTEIRLISGSLAMWFILVFRKDKKIILQTFIPSRNWRYMLPGSVIGAYFSMLIWLAGIKFTQANIASAINQTNVIFVLILAVIFLKEKFTLKKVVGVMLAFSGVLFVTFG